MHGTSLGLILAVNACIYQSGHAVANIIVSGSHNECVLAATAYVGANAFGRGMSTDRRSRFIDLCA